MLKSIAEGTAPIQDVYECRQKLHWLGLIEQRIAAPPNLSDLQSQERKLLAKIRKALADRSYSRARELCYEACRLADSMDIRPRYFATSEGLALLRDSRTQRPATPGRDKTKEGQQ